MTSSSPGVITAEFTYFPDTFTGTESTVVITYPEPIIGLKRNGKRPMKLRIEVGEGEAPEFNPESLLRWVYSSAAKTVHPKGTKFYANKYTKHFLSVVRMHGKFTDRLSTLTKRDF